MIVDFTFRGRGGGLGLFLLLSSVLLVLLLLLDEGNTVQSNPIAIAKRSPSFSSSNNRHGLSKLNHLLKRINAEAHFLMANNRMVAVNRGFAGQKSMNAHKKLVASSAARLRHLLRVADRQVEELDKDYGIEEDPDDDPEQHESATLPNNEEEEDYPEYGEEEEEDAVSSGIAEKERSSWSSLEKAVPPMRGEAA
ncbi:hypothetical protein TYRP_015612 [Tyrophagus putrescentiae]|nr:hypothetical protein TYRP_015612 [Tyrophagus putrescentiae]